MTQTPLPSALCTQSRSRFPKSSFAGFELMPGGSALGKIGTGPSSKATNRGAVVVGKGDYDFRF